MEQLVADFHLQLKEALIIGQSYRFVTPPNSPFNQVVLTGLGGSGIGGSIVQNYVADKLKIPFLVNKDYALPASVGRGALVIVSSYSGNTEETLSCLKQAIKARATVVCITSGGQVAEIAHKKKMDCILVPAGMPPRACIGYSVVQVLFTLRHFGLLQDKFDRDIKAAIRLLNMEEESIRKEARKMAGKLQDKLPVIYASGAFEGMAIRFRQQLNENSKVLAWHGVVPEMNHNELVGWKDKDPGKVVIYLRSEADYERVQARMEINKKIIKKYTPNILELWAKGKSYWEQLFYFIHLTDWVSVYLSELRGQDANEIKVIDYLKGEMSKA